MIYKEIPFAPGYYITADGQIGRKQKITGLIKPLKSYLLKGYLEIVLRVAKKPRNYKVHRLVLETWIGPPPVRGSICRHLNDIPLDNRAANLAWGSGKDNYRDRIQNNIDQWKDGSLHMRQKLTPEQVLQIKQAIEDKKAERAIAREFNVDRTTIRAIRHGWTWSNVQLHSKESLC